MFKEVMLTFVKAFCGFFNAFWWVFLILIAAIILHLFRKKIR